jgi:hypothetical protein
MKYRLLTALLAAAVLCAIAQPASGDGTRAIQPGQNVSGPISAVVVWSAAGGPWNVIDDVTVEATGNLTVEAGATVLFSRGTRLTVNGLFHANGTTLDGVLMTSAQAVQSTSDWDGIWVNDGGRARFDNTNVHFSRSGVNVTGGEAVVANCTISFHVLCAVRAGLGSNVTVADSVISSCQYDGLLYDNGSSGSALRNTITSCQYGIVTYSDVLIRENRFDEDYIGIYSYNNTGRIERNNMTSCWDGIIAFYSDPVITDNVIQGCLGNATRFFVSNATYTGNILEYNRIGLDIPYDSRGVLANLVGNFVNGIDISQYYFYDVDGITLQGRHFDSGWGAGYRDSQGGPSYLNGQGAFTFYDCTHVVIEDCLIENNWYGLGLVGTYATVRNSTIRNVEVSPGFLDLGSELTAINVTYTGANYTIRDDGSIAMEYEYVRALVRNETHSPIEGASCNLSENGVEVASYVTDSTGHTPWVLALDRTHTNISGTFVSEVTIDVDFEGRAFDDDPRTFTLPTWKELTFTDLGDVWAPKVVSFNVTGGALKTNLTPIMTLRFDEEMDRASVENATSLHLGNASVPLDFAWDGWNVTISPQSPLDYSTTYGFAVATTATDLKGNALENPYATTLTTEQAPSAVSEETLMYVAIAVGVGVFVAMIVFAYWSRNRERKE